MNIVIDSNVLFSALIKDSTTRRLILEYGGLFLFPSVVLDEARKHMSELLKKSGMTPDSLNQLLSILLAKVKTVPDESLYAHREKALGIVKDVDPGDALFVACALAYPNSAIWSNDKGLKKQTKVKVLNTEEILKLFTKNNGAKEDAD